MPDVTIKVIEANDQKNNRVVVYTPKLRSNGTITAKDSGENKTVDVAVHESALGTRFDDPAYYTN